MKRLITLVVTAVVAWSASPGAAQHVTQDTSRDARMRSRAALYGSASTAAGQTAALESTKPGKTAEQTEQKRPRRVLGVNDHEGLGQGQLPAQFRLFDTTTYNGKPNLAPRGWSPAWTDGHSFWRGNMYEHARMPEDVDYDKFRASVQRAADTNQLYIINIEHWDFYRNPEHRAALTRMLDFANEVAPSLRVGVYAIFPKREYWPAVNYAMAGGPSELESRTGRVLQIRRELDALPSTSSLRRPLVDEMNMHTRVIANLERRRADFDRWTRVNELFSWRYTGERGPADAAGAILPSVYAFYANATPRDTEAYVRENILQAKRYGKPVYAFMWLKLHNREELQSLADLEVMARTVRQHADGLVLWGGWREQWTPEIEQRVRLIERICSEPATASTAP